MLHILNLGLDKATCKCIFILAYVEKCVCLLTHVDNQR